MFQSERAELLTMHLNRLLQPSRRRFPALIQTFEVEPPKPTRIIRPPYLVKAPTKGANMATMLDCDDGKTYTLKALAHIVGIKAHGLGQRINNYGWDYPAILAPKARKGCKITGEAFSFGEMGNAAWQALGDKVRTHNLKKIRPCGAWEETRK